MFSGSFYKKKLLTAGVVKLVDTLRINQGLLCCWFESNLLHNLLYAKKGVSMATGRSEI